MHPFEATGILDFDHLEFAVNNLEQATSLYLRMGFERAGTREILERELRSELLVYNQVAILLSSSTLASDPIFQFVKQHGDGVCSIGFRCRDAVSTLETVVSRGGESADPPRAIKRDFGSVHQCSIKTFGDVRNTFISREGTLFLEGFDAPIRLDGKKPGMSRIDHVTVNVEKGKMEHWANFFEKLLGLVNTRFFDIHTERTGLYSKVMQSPDGTIKMPFNEPTESASQIQEFLDINHGPGVQHVALLTEDICNSVTGLKQEGFSFLEVPQTYYDEVPKRVPNVAEAMSTLSNLGILVDGDQKGYLLQIFTQNVVGPFFYEVIQRKGNDGFGEGNFRALFEAIERDQMKRGVLK